MKSLVFIFFICLDSFLIAQERSVFWDEFSSADSLSEINTVNEFKHQDFSSLWTETDNSVVYGVIGEEHQRIRIKIMSINRNPLDSLEYIVHGKSMVKENICDFLGTIHLEEIYELTQMHFGVDDEFKSQGIKKQAVLKARYTFTEDINQKHTGVFRGELFAKFYIDSLQNVQYDNIEIQSDGYMNNAFIGTWQSRNTKLEKRCNWGDYRVPQCNADFDIGVAEFSVSEKYMDKGWLDIVLNQRIPNGLIKRKETDEAIQKEWWE